MIVLTNTENMKKAAEKRASDPVAFHKRVKERILAEYRRRMEAGLFQSDFLAPEKKLSELTTKEFEGLLKKYLPTVPSHEKTHTPTEHKIKKVPLKKLSQLYGWGESTIRKWSNDRFIPHFRVNAEYWFDLDEIEQWLSEKRVRTLDELNEDFRKNKKFYK